MRYLWLLVSAHIVEDIAQTCHNLAVMKSGQVVFQGTTIDLIRETQGKVWIITTQGIKPQGAFAVVSTLNMGTSMQYRVVGDEEAINKVRDAQDTQVTPTDPGLEDGYVWLMREQRATERVVAF